MMGFKEESDTMRDSKSIRFSEQWWDLKAEVPPNSGVAPAGFSEQWWDLKYADDQCDAAFKEVLANNDGI